MPANNARDDINSPPAVSIIMANYNGAAYLADAIRSAGRQTLRNIEIIVSDDASTDGSVAIVEQAIAEDSRIRLVASERNCGPAAARNKALEMARGEWIAVMDSDDLMHPDRLQTLLEAANRDGADIVADDLLIFDSDHIHAPRPLLTGARSRAPFWVDSLTYVRLNPPYGRGPILGYLKPLIRSSILAHLPGPYDESLRIAEDYNLILRLLGAGARYRVYPALHYFYRTHAGSVSHRLRQDVLVRIRNADLALLRSDPAIDRPLAAGIRTRIRSIDAALAFERLLEALKTGAYFRALATVFADPRTMLLLRFPIGARLRRLLHRVRPRQPRARTQQVCIISRQRIVGRTNGSSAYLLDLVAALAARAVHVHFLSPSPATLGRWPFLSLSNDISVFRTFRVRGTWRVGHCLISKDPRRVIQALLAVGEKILVNNGLLSKPVLQRAPYSIAEPLTREDQLFLARHAPRIGDYLIADYCFLTEAFPYALRPDARSAVIMHDLFSSRAGQFEALKATDSVAALKEDQEFAMLARADCIVAVQREEAAAVRRRLPNHRVLVVAKAARPVSRAQPGDDNLALFVGSNAAPNVDGLRWFLESCWPDIRARRPSTRLCVAGTVSQLFGPPPEGVAFLGLVDDLTPLYRQAGLVVSPLRVGSGLKIKLIEALERGKAVVASPATLQGVADWLAGAVRLADSAEQFATAVVTLLDDQSLRVSLATRGLEAIARHFSPDACYGPLIEEITGA